MKSDQEKHKLEAADRKIFGKRLKKIRREGQVPANIYGPKFKSQSISIPLKDFQIVYRKAKETGVVYIALGKDEVPTLIKNVQKHPVGGQVLHVDFRKIDLTQKIETEVPIIVTGTSEAVAHLGGVLITQNDHLLVEALPTDIPQSIEIDITALKEVGQDIKVSDLPKSAKYTIKNDLETVIVSVTAHKEESLVPETAPAEAPEVITEKEGEEGAVEGEAAPAEGEEKKVEGKEEKKPETKTEEKKPAEETKKE